MARLTKNEKETIIDLINIGTSINDISKITNKAKSTIYYYYQKLKGRKCSIPKFNFSEQELGEFIGIFAGDGSFYLDKKLYKYTISIFTGHKDRDYKEKQIIFLNKIFNKRPNCFVIPKKNVFIIRYYSRDIYNLLKEHLEWNGVKTYSVRLRNIDNTSRDFKIGFLRGLLDTDGSFYKPKHRISYGTVSEKLSLQTLNLIKSLGFFPKCYISNPPNRSKFYSIVLHGEQTRKFIKLINPRNIDKLTRQSSNGRI